MEFKINRIKKIRKKWGCFLKGAGLLRVLSILILAFAFFIFTAGFVSFLHEGMHSLGHTPYSPSFIGKLFDDGTRIPLLFSKFSFITLILVASLEWKARKSSLYEAFEKAYTYLLIPGILLFSVLSYWFYMNDFTYVPRPYGPPYGNEMLVILVNLILALAAFFLYKRFKRNTYLLIFTILPFISSIMLVVSARQTVRQMLIETPSVFPGIFQIVFSGVILTGVFLGFKHWTRVCNEELFDYIMVPISLVWAYFSFNLIAVALPFHHLCSHGNFLDLQRWFDGWLITFFLVLWVSIIIFYVLKMKKNPVDPVKNTD